MNRIVLLDETSSKNNPDVSEIFDALLFIHEKERLLMLRLESNVLELCYVMQQYKRIYQDTLNNGTSLLEHYMKEINASQTVNVDIILELMSTELSTYFKSYLILVKSVLDKMVPLFDYRFNYTLTKFSDKGDKLLKVLSKKFKGQNKEELIQLIEKNKKEWINDVITLRDSYIHYSNLPQYMDFHLLVGKGIKKTVEGIEDFNEPIITLKNGNAIKAIDFLEKTFEALKGFVREFLTLCLYDRYNKPRLRLKCNCGFEFGKINDGVLKVESGGFQINQIDKKYHHGVMICPKCSKKTDTDFDYWGKIIHPEQ